MKKETDPFKLAVLDGRQLALKVSANRRALVRVLSALWNAVGARDILVLSPVSKAASRQRAGIGIEQLCYRAHAVLGGPCDRIWRAPRGSPDPAAFITVSGHAACTASRAQPSASCRAWRSRPPPPPTAAT